ncbi:sigma factor-like helix-turn-helix DNA-binding protein [Endozoicomonas sp.]|uniref:sigma factor-like helix-turn-helix DNA-binding protein n=1 Tax=Endozoicomonas sp. TaxID=1892382 RepID=UPI0028849C54|nr:sigma factor-like helix-turn-helix DNA-binding protein [Endozoicomonas sp.]
MDKKTIKAKELQRKALELRTLGLSYRQIGDQLGVSKTAAYKAVAKALGEVEEETRQMAKLNKTLDLQRLDWIIREAMKQALKGDLQAMDRIMKAIDQRAKIYGFEAPKKIAHTTPDGDKLTNQGNVLVPALPVESNGPPAGRRDRLPHRDRRQKAAHLQLWHGQYSAALAGTS